MNDKHRFIEVLSNVNELSDEVISVEQEMFVEYKYKPRTRDDLIELIHDRMEENQEDPYLLDIDTSEITDMSNLFSTFHWTCHLDYHHPNPRFLKRLDLTTWNTSKVTSLYDFFWGCEQLETVEGFQNWDLSKCKVFSSMFYNCEKLTNIDLSCLNSKRKMLLFSSAFNNANPAIIQNWSKCNFDLF